MQHFLPAVLPCPDLEEAGHFAFPGPKDDVSISERIEAIRIEIADHRQCHGNTRMLEHHFEELEREMAEIQAWHRRTAPVRLRLTFHTEGAADMADRYAAGTPIPVSVKALNAEGDQVPDTVSWSTSSGTLTDQDPSTLAATIVNAAVGTLTVTVTDPNGLSATGTVEIYDGTPTSLELSFN